MNFYHKKLFFTNKTPMWVVIIQLRFFCKNHPFWFGTYEIVYLIKLTAKIGIQAQSPSPDLLYRMVRGRKRRIVPQWQRL